MTTIEVTAEKTDWSAPKYSLTVDGELCEFDFNSSRKITNTQAHAMEGIFTNLANCTIKFKRDDTEVRVEFGCAWDISSFENPALEIRRRIALVNDAFDAVKESYTKSWSVEF
jgi:hypothetical protein